jgi:hypothetical protein
MILFTLKNPRFIFDSISAVSRLDVNKEKNFEREKKLKRNSFLKFETDFTKCHQLSQIFIYSIQ